MFLLKLKAVQVKLMCYRIILTHIVSKEHMPVFQSFHILLINRGDNERRLS